MCGAYGTRTPDLFHAIDRRPVWWTGPEAGDWSPASAVDGDRASGLVSSLVISVVVKLTLSLRRLRLAGSCARSRAITRRRSEWRRFSSASDDDSGGFPSAMRGWPHSARARHRCNLPRHGFEHVRAASSTSLSAAVILHGVFKIARNGRYDFAAVNSHRPWRRIGAPRADNPGLIRSSVRGQPRCRVRRRPCRSTRPCRSGQWFPSRNDDGSLGLSSALNVAETRG